MVWKQKNPRSCAKSASDRSRSTRDGRAIRTGKAVRGGMGHVLFVVCGAIVVELGAVSGRVRKVVVLESSEVAVMCDKATVIH